MSTVRRAPAALLLCVTLGCLSSRSHSQGLRPYGETTTLFDFHVGFWVNLHQRLFAESSSRPPRDVLHAESPADEQAWAHAVEVYRHRYSERSFLMLLENEELIGVNRSLARQESAPNLASAELPREIQDALEQAAPVYRRSGWPADERAGLGFRDRLAALVAGRGSALASALSAAYGTPWPAAPVRVDVAAFAGPVGAYTVLEPTHITLASGDRRHLGDAGLEILFHEASHGLVNKVASSIAQACQAQGKQVPPTLWHAVLFYGTGEVVRRQLGTGYTPYAYVNGLYARSPDWAVYETLLARYWPAYLDGRQSLDVTVQQVVAGL
jgi:hypothetical protein